MCSGSDGEGVVPKLEEIASDLDFSEDDEESEEEKRENRKNFYWNTTLHQFQTYQIQA